MHFASVKLLRWKTVVFRARFGRSGKWSPRARKRVLDHIDTAALTGGKTIAGSGEDNGLFSLAVDMQIRRAHKATVRY